MTGVILCNKEQGVTSAEIVRRVKKIFKDKKLKVGHAGTLDPDATGILVLLLGEATKIQDLFMSLPKAYRGKIKLGYQTSTDDLSGEVITEGKLLPLEELREKVNSLQSRFIGEIDQAPPQVSAVKVNGERAYDLARAGLVSDLKVRKVRVHDLKLEVLSDSSLYYEVCSSKGFYVRSLARDLGQELGTLGATESIERYQLGSFTLDDCVRSGDFSDEEREIRVLSLEEISSSFSVLELSHDETAWFKSGNQLMLKNRFSEFKSIDNYADNYAFALSGAEVIGAIERAGYVSDPELNSQKHWQIKCVFNN